MNTKTTIGIVAGIAVVIILLGGQGLLTQLFGGSSASASANTSNTQTVSDVTATTTMQDPTQLQIQDVTVGTGATAVSGDQVTVNYIGVLQDGTKFDSSYDRGTPFTFTLGAGQVIKGWDEGVAGMKVGGKRILVIPASLGYGDQAVGSIPANSTLIFQVELLGVK